VTLESSFIGGLPAFTIGTTVGVRLQITANTSGQIPSVAAVRVGYDSSLFAFVSATGGGPWPSPFELEGDLGGIDPFAVGAAEVVSGSMVTRDIPTVGNFINTDPTPFVMDVVFQVLTNSGTPTNLTLEFDPGVSAGLNSLLDVNASPIAGRSIDAAATSNILVPVSMSSFEIE
jgi:hypothetical protein